MDSGSIYSNIGPGMLGLEMSLHHQIPQQNPHHMQQQQQHPTHLQPPPPPHPIVSYGHQETENQQQQQQSLRQGLPFGNKAKNQSLTFSDEDDNNSVEDGKRNKTCPWQRMKWTDNMVRLLIMVVYYIGDEVGSEVNNNNNDTNNSKKKGGGSVGVLQKKGKWKSVSRAMMERGFYVSPQQCEDKFNDLNKRYKRVNDILGKGTACRVVENQNLLETMDQLTQKLKEEVKKLLNSKHLFFREMCAYHNSCGHNNTSTGGGSGNVQLSTEVAVEANTQTQKRCLHSSENARIEVHLEEGTKMAKGKSADDDQDEDEEDEDEDEEEDDDEEVSGARGRHEHHHNHVNEYDDDMDERSRKRQRNSGSLSPMVQQLSSELANVIQDGGRSSVEKRQWLKTRMVQLEEQHVGYLCQAFELQKQRLKWEKFTSKKEREMEKEKLINERKKLENERMVLLLRKKELELLDFHQNHNRNGDPSSVTG
ncbi:PREDICTED: uncharacterized protein DDB_G0284311 [Nicotiana attenuata]|uniref:Myb/SANT-like DNA-binding domain-containing protein n=1 Tax=Nicotiana attenuata TaxID=49451 RepID=A0A1J6I8W5_NICAT|nr:PREDICTED: uncharacterized protein DDB_G0284311 [Nicotiana attenuata]OIT01445.1 hypothetical protein A4A49_02858 [Nicotiana attenuata]